MPEGKDALEQGVPKPFPDLGGLLEEVSGWGMIAWLLALVPLPGFPGQTSGGSSQEELRVHLWN